MLWLTLGLLGVLGGGMVTAETDPLVQGLLSRMEAMEKLGLQQQQRILQLEEEVQRLKGLDPSMGEVVGTDNDVTADVTGEPDREIGGEEETVSGLSKISKIPPYQSGNPFRRFVLDTEEACFHATLDDGLHEHNHLTQILVFDQVKLNLGAAYNNKTGIFVTPINGIYIFSLSIRAITNNTHIDIMRNGEEVGAVFAHSGDQGSITIAQFLNVGDTMHVAVVRHDDVTVWGDKLTSFMGCLITPY